MARPLVDVFGYLDYRAFLRDYYAAKKARGRGFSFRSFSKKAALGSPNYLKLVMDGDRSLTAEMAERFAAACELTGEAASYFCDLVAFNQAKSAAARSERYERLSTFRRYRAAHKLELAQAAYHSTWYLPAIRELAARADFSEDPAWIATTLVPAITPAEASAAVARLLELRLLVRGEDGRVKQGDALVTTGAESQAVHLRNYHRTMIARGAEAIDLVAQAERDVSSLTLCLGKDGLRRFKERLQRFRRELLELSALESAPEQVVQINFQLFPLSRSRTEESST